METVVLSVSVLQTSALQPVQKCPYFRNWHHCLKGVPVPQTLEFPTLHRPAPWNLGLWSLRTCPCFGLQLHCHFLSVKTLKITIACMLASWTQMPLPQLGCLCPDLGALVTQCKPALYTPSQRLLCEHLCLTHWFHCYSGPTCSLNPVAKMLQ